MAKRLPNYSEDINPFKLAGPPNWFLRELWEFDSSLAIVPSRQGFYYRLAQRRPLRLPENVVNDVLKEQADTQMLASRGLVPVTTILATVNWGNPVIFEELRRMAPWRMGGAEAYEKQMLQSEATERLKQAMEQDDRNSYLAKDAWKLYNKKIGLRSHMWSPTVKGSRSSNTSASLHLHPPKPYTPLITSAWGNVLAKG